MKYYSFTALIICTALLACAPVHIATAATLSSEGKAIFESKCAKCHGSNGTKGLFGAKNLQASRLNDTELMAVITKGKKIMPAWGKRLTEPEIRLVISYIKTLRK